MAEMVLRATGSKLKIISEIHVTSTQAQYDTCLFEFDEAWDGYGMRTAVFYSNPNNIKAMLLDGDNKCYIPWDSFGNSRYLYIGVYGNNGESYLPTQFVEVMYQPGANVDDHLYPPTPGIYEQIAAGLSEIMVSMGEKASQADLDNLVQSVAEKASASTVTALEAQVLQKADSATVTAIQSQVTGLASGSPKGTYATLVELTAAKPAGDSSIYVVASDGNWYYWNGSAWTAGGVYQATGIADGSVLPEKTSFATSSTNLVDPDTVNIGHYINAGTGALVADALFSASDYVPVLAGMTYTMSQCRHIAFYNSSNVFISGSSPNQLAYTATAPAGAAYCRFSWITTAFPEMQFNRGETLLPYEIYGAVYLNSSVDASRIEVPLRVLDIALTSTNLNNRADESVGYYLNSSGVITALADWNTSANILVTPGEKYTVSITRHLYFYTSDGSKISGIVGKYANYTVTAPATAAFMRIAYYPVEDPALQVNAGEKLLPYEDYGYVIPETAIRKNTGFLPMTQFRATLPPKVYGVVGRELNIYFDGLGLDDYKNYDFDVTCTIGEQQANRFTVVPSAAGTYALTIMIYKDGLWVNRVATSLVISAADAGDGTLRSVLAIGDSTTANGVYTDELLALDGIDEGLSLVLRGTEGTSPNVHEGRSGWLAQYYVSDFLDNPFWNPVSAAFDLPYYMDTQGWSGPNYVIIHLGINDIFQAATDAEMETAIENGIAALEAMAVSAKIRVLGGVGVCTTIPPAYSQDAFGASCAASQTRWRYRRNLSFWNDAVVAQFSSREADKIYLIPFNICLDTENNFPVTTENANSRNETQVSRQSNGVHPANSGYYQMADMAYAWLKSFEV